MARTITAANSSFVLAIAGVFPVPIPIEGYATDDAFTNEVFPMAQALMGVDGKLSSGYTPEPKKLTVMLMPDSPSLEVFDAWRQATETAKEVFLAEATIVLPALGKTYNMRKGTLTSATGIPGVKKVLQPAQFEITFESIQPAAISNA